VLLAEEEPVAADGAVMDALFKESAERGDAGAGPDHDDVTGGVGGEVEGAGFLDVNRDILKKCLGMVGQKAGGETFLRPAMGLVADNFNTEMRFAGVFVKRGGNGVKARSDRREAGKEGLRGWEPAAAEFLEDIDVIAGIDVIRQKVGVVGDLQEACALGPIGHKVGQAGDNFAVSAVEGEVAPQGVAQGHSFPPGISNRRDRVKTEEVDDLGDEGRRILSEGAEGIAGGIAESAAIKVEDKMARVLVGARPGESIVTGEFRQERILAGEW